MQITRNSLGLPASLTVVADKDARDWCVVVVKGTFRTSDDGAMQPASEHVDVVYADEHYGDPETTSTRLECDFALHKPMTDVLVLGDAVPPGGASAREVVVGLEVEGRLKTAVVTGDRWWVAAVGSLVQTPPLPFTTMPLVFERAVGGPKHPENVVGVGPAVDGGRLPNLEHPRHRGAVIGFGVVGRAWQPRIGYAGTYDRHWLDHICPFLPNDFDHRYFQAAPSDQQFAHFRGGEVIRCIHMAAEPVVTYRMPAVDVPVCFSFRDRDVLEQAVLDTVILEPHHGRATLSWRARVALGKKIDALREVHIGRSPPASDMLGYRRGKPAFAGLGATLTWLERRRRR